MLVPLYDTVILSDLHLGSDTARAEEALETLQSLRFRRLILLGDMFADLNFGRLTKAHWQFLSHIRKLSNPRRGVEVVWIEGNHDSGLTQVMSHLVGIRVYQEYHWREAGLSCIAVHGHQWDRFVIHDRLLLCSIGYRLYLMLQKLESRRKRLARLLDRWNTRWLRLTEKVANGALLHAKARGAQLIFCGHTHQAMTVERDGVRYINTGAWTNERPTFVTIVGQEVAIHEYAGRTDYCYPGKERGETPAEAAGLTHGAGLPAAGGYEPAYS
jgi:UDP-2,3-diacylglucosamine pyrophosphatase LpxH